MAKHEITIHENKSVTKEVAPYTGTYISKETFRIENFKAKLAERCGLPAIQVQAILTGAFEAIESLEGEGLVRIHLDGFTVCGIITGSFPTADAAFNNDRNSLQMAVRLDEPIRNDLADVTPTIITDASVTKLRVDNVMDLESPRPYNVIHGKHVFRVAGFNMVLSDEGAEAYLENTRGTKFPLLIDEEVSKQLFKAHTETLLEPGDYKLVVRSKAGDAEGPLQTDHRRVKYMRVIDPPAVDDIASEGHTGEIVSGTAFAAKGSGLDAFDAEAGDTVKVKWTQGGEDKEATIAPAEVTGEKMSFEFPDALVGVPMDTELTFEITFGEIHKEKGSKLVEE